jgi:hypothetical protein
MRTYRAGTGVETQRLECELAIDEAEAFADAHEHLEQLGVDADSHPIFRGLRRIHRTLKLDQAGASD